MPRSVKEPTIKFAVTGRGPFPIDMLRYDCCFPFSQSDSATINRTFQHGPHDETHTVVLRYMREYKPRGLTDARWRSMGYDIAAEGDTDVMLYLASQENS